MFEQIMDRQKLMRMIDRSERIYLRRGGGKHTKRLTCFIHSLLLCFRLISHTRNITNSGHEWTYGLKCLTLSDSEYISHYVAKVSLLLASVQFLIEQGVIVRRFSFVGHDTYVFTESSSQRNTSASQENISTITMTITYGLNKTTCRLWSTGLRNYLQRTAQITASVIKARQDRPQPMISVTDGTPEYSMACGEDRVRHSSQQGVCSRGTHKSHTARHSNQKTAPDISNGPKVDCLLCCRGLVNISAHQYASKSRYSRPDHLL